MTHVTCVGHAVEDHVFQVAAMPASAKKHRAQRFELVGGGPAANAAVTIARLGGKTDLIARLGDDAVGHSIIRDLQQDDVAIDKIRRFPGRTSSVSSVFVDESGERMIVNYADPDMPRSGDWVKDAIPHDTDAVLADCRWAEGAVVALRWAKERGKPAVLDADHPLPPDPELINAATHVAFSADGLADFAGHSDLERGIIDAAQQTDAWCAVTAGEHGVYFADNGAAAHVPGYTVKTVDTLGAGDVWHGAFALALARHPSVHDALQFANAAAALKVTKTGGRQGIPTATALNDFIKTHS